MKTQSWVGLCVAGAVSCGTWLPSAAAVDILYDTFDSPSYSSFAFNDSDAPDGNPDDTSFEAIGDTDPAGGNPGSYLELFHFHDVARDENDEPVGDSSTSLQSFFNDQSTTYTPSVSGEIESFSFSLDVRTDSPFEDLFFEILDDNGGSVANAGSGFLSIVNDGEWQTLTLTGVMQAGAQDRDFAGSEPLSFGFGFLSSLDVFDGQTELQIDVDNFIVTAQLVPEPTAGLLLFGLACVVRGRRRTA